MEPNDNQLSSYFHHHQHHHQSPTTSPTNGLLPSTHHLSSADATTHVLYPHSVPSAAISSSPLEPGRRKRGRPRKYGTPEEALAAKKAATASSHSSSKAKKDLVSSSSLNAVSASSKKSQLAALGGLSCYFVFVLKEFVVNFFSLVGISRDFSRVLEFVVVLGISGF